MKRINSLFIIIFATFVSVIIMVSFDYYVYNLNCYEEDKLLKSGVVQYKKPSNSRITNNGVKMVVEDETKDKKLKSDYKNENKTEGEKGSDRSLSVNSSNTDDTKNNEDKDSLANYYNYIDKNEKSVFKVSASKIKEDLTTSDKIKLLYVSMELDKEDYNKVKGYLYDKDAEDGVLKALKLLKKDLSEKEYDKVRKVAQRFIDMNLAEGLD